MFAETMNSGNDEMAVKNLLIRNDYKEHIIGIRCQELRRAFSIISDLKRHCDSLKEDLERKRLDNVFDMQDVKQLRMFSDAISSDRWINQEVGLNDANFSSRNRSPLSDACKAVESIDSGKKLDTVSHLDIHMAGDASLKIFTADLQDFGCLLNANEEQRKDSELNLVAFEKEELQMESECTASEKLFVAEEHNLLLNEVETVENQLEEARKKISKKNRDIEQLTVRLSLAERQIKELSELVEGLRRDADEKECARMEGEKRQEDLEDLLMLLQTEKAEFGNEQQSKVASLTEKSQPKLSLKVLVEEQEDMIDELASEKKGLDDQLMSQNLLVTELKQKVLQLEGMLKQSNEKHLNVEWEKEKNDLKEQIEILGGQLTHLQYELAGSQHSSSGQSQQLTSQFPSLLAETSILQAEKENLEEKLEQVKVEFSEMKESHDHLKIQLKCTAEELDKRNKDLQKLRQTFLSEKSQLMRSIQNFQAEIAKEKLVQQKSSEKLSSLEGQNTELLSQLLVFEDKYSDASCQLEQANCRLEMADREMMLLKRTISERNSSMNELILRNQQLQSESLKIIESLGRMEEELRKQRSYSTEKIGLLCAEIQEGKNKKELLESKLNSEKNRALSLKTELEKLVIKNKQIETELHRLSDQQKLNYQSELKGLKLISTADDCCAADDINAKTSDAAVTPNKKRFRIGSSSSSSRRIAPSTTQILQTPASSAQESVETMAECFFVPESPIASKEMHEVQVKGRRLPNGKTNCICLK